MTAAFWLLGLGALAGVRAQTNASLALPAELSGLPLSGEVVGTGADGTTYVVSASGTDSGDVLFTMTVVQDATHVSEALSLATGLGANVQCDYNSSGVGVCTMVLEGAGTGTDTNTPPQTTVSSGTIPMFAVPVTTASASATQPTASGSATASDSGSAESTSASDSSAGRNAATVGLTAILSMLVAVCFNA